MAESSLTASFWSNLVVQLWFPVWREQLGTAQFQAGVNEAAFAAEYAAITGKPFPVAVPPPVNPPVNPPGPDAADEALAGAVGSWPQQHHTGETGVVARALEKWLAAKNLSQHRHS